MCSIVHEMMCPRFTWPAGAFSYMYAAPLIARLLLSVDPEVKMISLGSAPISAATCSRAMSTPSSASQPYRWLRLPGFPNLVVKYGSIASTTRGSHGVVAAWSR